MAPAYHKPPVRVSHLQAVSPIRPPDEVPMDPPSRPDPPAAPPGPDPFPQPAPA